MKRILSALLLALFTSASVAQTVTTTGANAPALPGSSGSTTGSGAVVLQTSPTLVTPTLGVATATSINGNTITTGTGTLTLGASKTLTVNNTMTLNATDTAVLSIGAGGTLSTGAYTTVGTAAVATIGTSGGTVPLLNGNNVWSGTNSWTALGTFNKNNGTTLGSAYQLYLTSGAAGQRAEMLFSDGVTANTFLSYLPSGTAASDVLTVNMQGVDVLQTKGNRVVALSGSLVRPIATETGATRSVALTDTHIIANRAGTVTLTLPAAGSFTGREITVRTITANTVVSDASNVVPCVGGSAGTAILAATAGKWALLVSDGTNWQVQMCN